MKIIEAAIGVYTADGEKVGLAFQDADLVLTFVDWREQPQRHVFRDVLGFRWDGECDESEIRDDRTYEVVDSAYQLMLAPSMHPGGGRLGVSLRF